MDCREFRRLIWEELDGALEGSRLERFNEHRKNCPACEREYFKQRRLMLYMKAFPTVGNVSDNFRRELVTRVRNGDLRSNYHLNYARISMTMALFALVLTGMLFGVNSYREYMVGATAFVARYSEDPDTIKGAGLPTLEEELQLREGEPVYALSLPNLRTEDFVLKLLANYENGESSERLVSVLAEKTGLLNGVSMHLQQSSSIAPFIGQPAQTVVIFPKALPDMVVASVNRSDLLELRQFTLDVINTYSQVTTPFQSAPSITPGLVDVLKSKYPQADIIDVAGGSFDAELVPEGEVPLVMTFGQFQQPLPTTQ
jgi:hypothetical protein